MKLIKEDGEEIPMRTEVNEDGLLVSTPLRDVEFKKGEVFYIECDRNRNKYTSREDFKKLEVIRPPFNLEKLRQLGNNTALLRRLLNHAGDE